MSNLISRQAFLDFIESVPFLLEHQNLKAIVIDCIKQQPTAYDVDKVVEQLEEKELNCLKKDVITSNKRYRHMAYAFRQAIGVVKGGGE